VVEALPSQAMHQLEKKNISGHWDGLLAQKFDARLAGIVI